MHFQINQTHTEDFIFFNDKLPFWRVDDETVGELNCDVYS